MTDQTASRPHFNDTGLALTREQRAYLNDWAEKIWSLCETDGPLSEVPAGRLFDAVTIAVRAHLEQTRDDGTPYLEHPARICRILVNEVGVTELKQLLIALLHDTVEDGVAETAVEIRGALGDEVCDGVLGLTKQYALTGVKTAAAREGYYLQISALPADLLALKLADRLDNVRDLTTCPDRSKVSRYIAETRRRYLEMARRRQGEDLRIDRLAALIRAALHRLTDPADEDLNQAALMMPMKLSGLRAAPPTRAPSMSG